MKICVIGNFSDRRCGILNFCNQTVRAFTNAGLDVTAWDGTYSTIYARRQSGLIDAFWPPDLEEFDIVHFIWHALTINHYTGADWARFDRSPVVKSFWDCGPSDAYCPFDSHFPVKWMLYPRAGYHVMDYPVPDWIDDLPEPAPVFTVGASSVRGDGVQWLQQICEQEHWALNLPAPSQWLSIEDEIRRLARSTINVCWYNSSAVWEDRASAPSMLIASRRPLLINQDKLLAHLHTADDIYHGGDLPIALGQIYGHWTSPAGLTAPLRSYARMRWTTAIPHFLSVWKGAAV